MAYTRRWTPMEDRVLRHNVTICGDNITEACEMSAPILGRTAKACQFRWYSKLSKEVDIAGLNFNLKGVEKETTNKKNRVRRNNKKKKTSFIQRLFKRLFS